MAPTTFQGKKVSRRWSWALNAAQRDGVRFQVTDGKRSIADQWARVRKHGVWSPSNPTGAARPTPGAPHVRWGKSNHALDVGSGEQALQSWLQRKGMRHLSNTVATEPWHLDPTDRNEFIRVTDKWKPKRKKRKSKKR